MTIQIGNKWCFILFWSKTFAVLHGKQLNSLSPNALSIALVELQTEPDYRSEVWIRGQRSLQVHYCRGKPGERHSCYRGTKGFFHVFVIVNYCVNNLGFGDALVVHTKLLGICILPFVECFLFKGKKKHALVTIASCFIFRYLILRQVHKLFHWF